MSEAVFAPETEPILKHADDCRRVRDLARRHGFTLSVRDAGHIWSLRSQQAAEGWTELPGNDRKLFEELLPFLHEWLAENGDLMPPRQEPLPRAPIVDEAADGPCEVCAGWAAQKYAQDSEGKLLGYRCDECGEIIPDLGVMRGRGFAGVVPHHYHLSGIGPSGVPGKRVILQELCPDCYRRHRQLVYPNESPKELERHLRA